MSRAGAKKRRAAPRPPRPREPLDVVALVFALLAIVIRLPHLGWGLPEIEEEALPARQALDMWNWPDPVNLDPHTAGWPSLSFYVHLLLQHLHYAVGRVLGMFTDRNDYFVLAWLDLGRIVLLSRALDVVLAALIVWLGAHYARRLAGMEGAILVGGGTLVGGLLALSPLLVEHAQLVEPDMLVAVFAALAIGSILAIAERGERADTLWAGLWIGLGISSKYTPVLLLPAVFVAHAIHARPGRRLRAAGGAWLAVVAAAVSFALTSPFVVLHLGVLARDVATQTLHMTGGHFGQQQPGVIYYVTQVLGPGLGWSGFVAGVAGLTWAAWTLRGPWLALAACVLPYFLGLALLRTQFPRYMLPLLLPVALGLCGLRLMLRERLKALPRWGKVVLALVAFGPAALGTWRYHQIVGRPSSQTLANGFARQASDRHASILSELLALSLPTPRTARVSPLVLQALTPEQRARVDARRVYDIDVMPMYTIEPERSAFYYDLRHCLGHDYVVTSSAVRGRYLADSVRFRPQNRFYADLDHYGRLVQRFGGVSNVRGPEIRFYQILPDSAAAMVRARGELPLDSAAVAQSGVNPAEWARFSEAVGRAALARGMNAMAERYYRASYQAGTAAGYPESRQQEIAGILERLGGHPPPR